MSLLDDLKVVEKLYTQDLSTRGYHIIRSVGEQKRECCVCDPELLSHDYEEIAISGLPGTVGYQLYLGKKLIATAILNHETLADMLVQIGPLAKILYEKSSVALQNFYTLTMLCVLPQFQGKGVAELLMIQVMMDAIYNGIPGLFLRVSKGGDNPRAITFYKKIGFTEIPLSNFVMINHNLISSLLKLVTRLYPPHK